MSRYIKLSNVQRSKIRASGAILQMMEALMTTVSSGPNGKPVNTDMFKIGLDALSHLGTREL